MPRIEVTSHLARHTTCPPEHVEGATVRAVLEAYFRRHPGVRTYVLDEQGALRKHVVIFIGDTQARSLDDAASGDIWIMQALSGG